MFEKPGERGRDNTPLYLQLANRLREQISCGGIGPGKALPSERDLSSMTGMSRVTVRKGIDLLIEEGLLFRKQGSGTFVRPQPIETPGAALSSFTDDARSRGEATVPSLLGEEKQTNPFLRADEPSVQKAVGLLGEDPVKVFAEVRHRKDVFR